MGWRDGRRGAGGTGSGPEQADLTAALTAFAVQLPAVGLIALIDSSTKDDYGTGLGDALGMACVLLFLPLILPLLGALHAVVHTMPAAALAHLVFRRARGPEWVWHLVCAAVVAMVWAGAAAALWGWPFIVVSGWLTGLAVLPVLWVAYDRRRAEAGERQGCWGVIVWSTLAAVLLCVVVGVGGLLGSAMGLIKNYQPPTLSSEQLGGVWHGDGGAVLRLAPDGRAELTKLPTEPDFGASVPPDQEFFVCDGTGTWELDTEGRNDRFGSNSPKARDGVVVRRKGCGDVTYWTIGGTKHDPELFVRFGDPDAGDLRILRRD
ncbi:MAG: hypothetical protein LBV60_02080 [Streptomyces sp.]|jgi:hypothetical protein|nr:hypothetical protein [Streptomyces sp.]